MPPKDVDLDWRGVEKHDERRMIALSLAVFLRCIFPAEMLVSEWPLVMSYVFLPKEMFLFFEGLKNFWGNK